MKREGILFDIIKKRLSDLSSSSWPACQAALSDRVIFSELSTSRRTTRAVAMIGAPDPTPSRPREDATPRP